MHEIVVPYIHAHEKPRCAKGLAKGTGPMRQYRASYVNHALHETGKNNPSRTGFMYP